MRENLFRTISIGPLKIEGNLFLAPLAGYTDLPFRNICKGWGASFTFSEMVSSEGLARGSKNTFELLKRGELEEQFGIQIFLSNSEVVERSLEPLLEANPSLIDINCGCPVPKVVKTGAGSALMKEPSKVEAIVKALTRATSVPVSVKFRTGWDHGTINYIEVADAALSGGASMVTMHARTKTMGYSGVANWSALATLKQFIDKNYPSIPLFGSGDLFSPEAAKEMLLTTGVDGVMFARGAMGNPFIFDQTRHLLTTGELPPPPSLEERLETLKRHLTLLVEEVGEEAACRNMRKHAPLYLKGLPHASKAKQLINQALTYDQYLEVTEQLKGG